MFYSNPSNRLAMRLGVLALLLASCPCPSSAAESDAAKSPAATVEPGFTSLFDGRTFEGWEGNLKHFRIEGGAIVAGSLKDKIPNNEFLCSKKRYGDFELRFDARLVGQGDNAGVQFRSERIPNHHEVNGYQCDIGQMQGKPIWGWLYDESRRKKFLAEASAPDKLSAALKKDDWNAIVIRCVGPQIQIWVNGVPTVDYVEKDEGIARTGILGLQIHGGPPAEASYRHLRIKELQP